MGLFKKVLGAATLGLVGDSPFKALRTGATQAGKQAKALGQEQLGRETDFMGEIKDLYDPRIQAGQSAFDSVAGYYGGDQQPIIEQAQGSPLYKAMVDTGESAIARHQQQTGGFRSGTTQENLAQNEQSVLNKIIQQILQGKAGVADAGASATNAFTQGTGNILNQAGGTSGQIANVDINQAAQRGNMLSGALGGITKAFGGL